MAETAKHFTLRGGPLWQDQSAAVGGQTRASMLCTDSIPQWSLVAHECITASCEGLTLQTVKKIWLIPVSLWQFWTALIQRPTCWLCLHLILHLSMHHTLSFILPNFLKRIIVTVKFIVLVTQSVRWAFPESLLHAPRTTLHPHPHPPAPPPRIPGLPHPSHWIHPSSVF